VVTGPQIRAARALLNLRQDDLAVLSERSLETVHRVESDIRDAPKSRNAIAKALTEYGVEFIENGVRVSL